MDDLTDYFLGQIIDVEKGASDMETTMLAHGINGPSQEQIESDLKEIGREIVEDALEDVENADVIEAFLSSETGQELIDLQRRVVDEYKKQSRDYVRTELPRR